MTAIMKVMCEKCGKKFETDVSLMAMWGDDICPACKTKVEICCVDGVCMIDRGDNN